MPAPISSLPIRIPEPISLTPKAASGAFQGALENAIGRVENVRSEANRAVDRFLSGDSEDLHTAAIAMQRAELSTDLFLQVRNKVVQAYQEIMRMQM